MMCPTDQQKTVLVSVLVLHWVTSVDRNDASILEDTVERQHKQIAGFGPGAQETRSHSAVFTNTLAHGLGAVEAKTRYGDKRLVKPSVTTRIEASNLSPHDGDGIVMEGIAVKTHTHTHIEALSTETESTSGGCGGTGQS